MENNVEKEAANITEQLENNPRVTNVTNYNIGVIEFTLENTTVYGFKIPQVENWYVENVTNPKNSSEVIIQLKHVL